MSAQSVVREKILSHSFGLASARGLNALSISDLARDLELSRRGLLAHFADKESLQLGVIDKAACLFISDVVDAAGKTATGEQRLRALFGRWLAWSRAPRLRSGRGHRAKDGGGGRSLLRCRVGRPFLCFTLARAVEIDF